MPDYKTVLKTKDLCIGFPGRKSRESAVYENINLQAGKTELVALLGANGIGKSTLLRSLVKLQDPLRGEISVFNQDISSLSRTQMARRVGFVSTEIVRVNNLSVYDLVALGRYPHTSWTGRLSGPDREKVDEAIGMVGMAGLQHKNINRLSDGERQRAMIARTLAQDTELIILDEPTAFLDLPKKYEIVHLLHRLAIERGKTIIFSTHDLTIAIQEADRLWLMLEDNILQGSPEDLILSGSFGKLFEKSNLKFNSERGEFRIAREPACNIYLEGPETEFFWTKNALGRSGFRVTSQKDALMAVRIESDREAIRWVLTADTDSHTFTSVYDLCTFLGKITREPGSKTM
jgi:iron complex transport system ATP-binding protein